MMVGRVPFLTITEFIRAKLKAWSMYVQPCPFTCLFKKALTISA